VRIVSLCPSLTELVALLGRSEALVGRTKFCVAPADVVEHVEKIGGTKDPRVERLVELAPDLVLMNREENRAQDAAALRERGLVLHTSLPRDPAGARELVLELGVLLEREHEAARIVERIDAALARVDERPRREPVSFVCLVWRKPWMATDRGTYLSALVERAGGVNLVAGAGGVYPELTNNELAALAPQRVLLPSEPFPFAQRHADELAAATGIMRDAFRLVDGAALTWHGSRTAAGLDEALAALA
jgi:ABC-type Fe3+-hydroxamate transport system substrate-binding protein